MDLLPAGAVLAPVGAGHRLDAHLGDVDAERGGDGLLRQACDRPSGLGRAQQQRQVIRHAGVRGGRDHDGAAGQAAVLPQPADLAGERLLDGAFQAVADHAHRGPSLR
ncbi:hypothetical protein GCM10010145_48430 [Streptomyces ruber]|uniref:Uncharacterized protein n=2 Tax=Streptomyces TaxID=1883 RepID=A0A918EUD4_9ACTN|nr:hypothetical protein GCM10010145_48430 [Streptomyces ruber]